MFFALLAAPLFFLLTTFSAAKSTNVAINGNFRVPPTPGAKPDGWHVGGGAKPQFLEEGDRSYVRLVVTNGTHIILSQKFHPSDWKNVLVRFGQRAVLTGERPHPLWNGLVATIRTDTGVTLKQFPTYADGKWHFVNELIQLPPDINSFTLQLGITRTAGYADYSDVMIFPNEE